MSPKRSSRAACNVRSAAISPTSPGSAARAAGVVSTRRGAAHHLANVARQRPGVGERGRVADREDRLVDEVRLAGPAPVDRGFARAGLPRDRIDRQVGVAGLGQQLDRRAQHRAVDAFIARAAKLCRHYGTQSNIIRHDRRRARPRASRRPGRAAVQPRGRPDPRPDGHDGAGCPLDADVLHAKAAAETGLTDFGSDDYRERLDVYLAALREIDGLHGPGIVNFHAQVLQLLKNRLLLNDLLYPPSRDSRHRTTAAGRHRRPAPHRHHAFAQPAGRGPDVSHHPVLGERRAVSAAGRGWESSRIHARRGWTSRSSS